MYINMRALENCIVLQLDRKVFNDVIKEHDVFSNKVGLYQNSLYSRVQKFPLDYIVEMPDLRRDRRIPKKKMEAILNRRSILKNIVFVEILKIREQMKKPKLGELLDTLKSNSDPQARDALLQKMLHLYQKDEDQEQKPDIKYQRLMSSFDRIQRSMNIWIECFDGMEKKIQKLLMRRQKREGLKMNAREYYREMLRQRMNAAGIVEKMKYVNERGKISKLIKRGQT